VSAVHIVLCSLLTPRSSLLALR